MMPLVLFALGLLASAFFSAVETAIVSVNRTRLSHRADSGDGGAARALRFLDDPRRLFGATLVGNNLANVFTATLATLWFAHRFGEGVVPWVVLGLTAVLLVVGEIVPKSIARAQADHLTVALTALLESFDAAMRPLVLIVTGASYRAAALVRRPDVAVARGDVAPGFSIAARRERGDRAGRARAGAHPVERARLRRDHGRAGDAAAHRDRPRSRRGPRCAR